MLDPMTRTRPAILTVLLLATCGIPVSPTSSVASADPPSAGRSTIAEVVEVSAPRRFAIELIDGERRAGPWLGFDLDGVRDESGLVPWTRIRPADRLRLGRDLIRATGPENAADWGLLLAALELSESGDLADRARSRLQQIAGDAHPEVLEAVRKRVNHARAARQAAAAERQTAEIRRVRPHLETRGPGGAGGPATSAIPAPRPGRLPSEIDRDRGTLRTLVEGEVDGLGLQLVPTTFVLVAGPDELETVAAMGVDLDRMLNACRVRLGGAGDAFLPAGGVAMILTETLDDARWLAARHRLDWPTDESSLVIPRPEGWIAIVAPPGQARIDAWASVLPSGTAADVLRRVEIARLAGRVAMLEAGSGRVPGWMVDGFAEAAAQQLVGGAPLERFARPPAVAALRAGRTPQTIVATASGDPVWAPDGEARRVAYLLVTRLLESGDRVLPGIVADLSGGASIDDAFRRWNGMTFDAWCADTVDWHRTND